MKSCWVSLKSGEKFGGILWEPRWKDGLIKITAIKLENGEIGSRVVNLNDVVYGECEVAYARADRDKFGHSHASIPLLSEARRNGWNPTQSFEGSISFSLPELIEKDIDITKYGLDLNNLRVIQQRDGHLLGYIDIPIGLARRLGLIDI